MYDTKLGPYYTPKFRFENMVKSEKSVKLRISDARMNIITHIRTLSIQSFCNFLCSPMTGLAYMQS